MKRTLTLLFALLAAGIPVEGQDVCPCVPVTHLWVVKSCDTFDCATSEFVISNGSPDTMVVPTTSSDAKWVVLQRVSSGSAIALDPTFKLESYDGWNDASARFAAIDSALKPMMLSSPDAKFLIVVRNQAEPRRRAVGRYYTRSLHADRADVDTEAARVALTVRARLISGVSRDRYGVAAALDRRR